MILTLYYMYATVLQWWRLGALKNKLNGTLNAQNALLVASGNVLLDSKNRRCLENLLFQNDNRIGCTVVPKQILNLNQFAQFPKDYKYFPIHIKEQKFNLVGSKLYVLVSAHLSSYVAHESDLLQIENYGELIGWKATDNFDIILKTDYDNLTKLVYYFSKHNVDINHDLQLLKLETIEVEGHPVKLKYDTKISLEQKLKFSHAPVHWKEFVKRLKSLYSKMFDVNGTTPKITIENGTKNEENKKVPISEVKPIKKENKKSYEKNENRLEVESRKYKLKDHKNTHRTVKESHETKEVSKQKEIHKTKESLANPETSHHTKIDQKPEKSEEHKTKEHKSVNKPKESHLAPKEHKSSHKTATPKPVMEANQKRNIFKQSSGDHKTDSKENELTPGTSKDVVQKTEASAKISSKDSEKSIETSKNIKIIPKICQSEVIESTAPVDDVVRQENIIKDTLTVSGKPCTKHFLTSTTGNVKHIKPPNVLVYADSLVAKDNVKNVLNTILNRDKYTIYDLPVTSSNYLWDNSTTLVVVCGSVTEDTVKELLQYLVSGGQLLCLCSDLLHSVLKTFTTAEVREHELVRFSYGEWKRVKMMHHIFCYQASPAKKQFSKDSDHSHSSNGSSPVAPRTPSAVDIQHNGKNYTIQVQVLGTEETWETPSLLLACVKNTRGRAVFSQVHLEIDPTEYQDDENKYAALKDSNQARLEIMKDILSKHLDMDCNNIVNDIAYTPAYFLGRHNLKLELLNNCANIKENKLELDKYLVSFCGKDIDPEVAVYNKLPILIHSCPSNFSTVHYFEELQTNDIGRLVFYSNVLTSTQFVLSKKLKHGLVVIARQQTQGLGRSNNCWLSPPGCAMFSMQLHIPLNSVFGRSLPLLQHFVMVAIVHSIKSISGYENLEIGIKWPNDLYAYSSIKIGGLVINSFIEPDMAVVNIGCGINLDNSNPTTCVNNVIKRHNDQNKTHLASLTYEIFFARVFNQIERLYVLVQNGQADYVLDLYYKYWLHSNAEITVNTKDGQSREVTVTGVDEFGFLKVKSKDGVVSSVQPDGNSFDMLKGLIAPKIF